MHLKRIELTNYRQHRNLDVDFHGNMIAVLGKNGVGKSNLIGGIQFALTGEQPPYKKADLTTWGEDMGSVRLYFESGADKREFCVTRKTNGDATLKVGDSVVKGAKKVEDALREMAGLDKELLRQVVFVPQKGIDAILFDDPKSREVAFQRLIGIGEASKIHEALRKEIMAYDKPSGFDEAIAMARQTLESNAKTAEECERRLSMYQKAVDQLPKKEDLQNEATALAATKTTFDELISVRIEIERVQMDMGRVMESAPTEMPREGEEDCIRTQIEKAKSADRFLTRLAELVEDVLKARDDVDDAQLEYDKFRGDFSTPIEKDRETLDARKTALTAVSAEARHLRQLSSEAASADGTCPLCGHDVGPDEIEAHVKGKLDELTAMEKSLDSEVRNLGDALRRRESSERELAGSLERAKMRLETAESALKNAKDKGVEGVDIDLEEPSVSYNGETPRDLPVIRSSIAGLQKRLDDIVSISKKAKEYQAESARLSARMDVLKGREKAAMGRIAELGADPFETDLDKIRADLDAKAEKARSNLEAYNGILRDMAEEQGRVKMLKESMDKTRGEIDVLEEKKRIDEKQIGKVNVLKRVQEWFHYGQGPRIMSQNVMRDLTSCVNSFLDQFCAPFVVEAEEEGFGFRCRFIDGRSMPDPYPDASLLSGGQKVALAIAFRLAIYMCFGGELGLLSLDEPTAYLDDASIEHLGELLQKVGEVARNKGLQILMATHEKAIMPYLDTKIDLNEMLKKGE